MTKAHFNERHQNVRTVVKTEIQENDCSQILTVITSKARGLLKAGDL